MYFEYWAPVLICVFIALASGLAFCILFGTKSRQTAFGLRQAAGRAEKHKRCSIQNMQSVEARIAKTGSPALREAWERYKADSDNLFGGEYAPEPAVYFTYEGLFEIPAHEKLQSLLQLLFPAFAVLSIIAPLSLLFYSGNELTPERVRACISAASVGVLIIILLYIVTFLCVRYIRQKNSSILHHFNKTSMSLFPVINQSTQAALLLRASQQNTEAFKATAQAIAEKIDDFAVNGITPVVSQAFNRSIEKYLAPGILKLEKALFELSNTVVRQQETGMRELAAAFADSLNKSLSLQIRSMAADMASLSAGLRDFNQQTQAQIAGLLHALGAHNTVLKETVDISRSVAAHQEATEKSIGDMSAALIRTEQLMDRLGTRDAEIFSGISANYDRIFELQNQLDGQLKSNQALSNENLAAIAKVSDTMSESVQSLIASTAETGTRTYDLISEKLTAYLTAANASNDAAIASIGSAVESLITSTNDTSEQTCNRISEKLTEVLSATAVIYENTGIEIRKTTEHLLAEIGNTVNTDFERIFARLSELLTVTNNSNAETYTRISAAVETLTSTVGQDVSDVFARYSGRLMEMLDETVGTNRETSQKLASTMTSLAQAGTEQYDKAAQAAAQLLDNVVIEMNRAMDGVGHEIADSIREASLGSAEIVNRLAEKTAQLKMEYDTYFSRIETQSMSNLSEIDYRIQNIFARFSNDATEVMNRLESNISRAVGLFEGNTTMMLQSMEEQSRSIGLYAKEINIDVAALTGSLRESVEVFTGNLQDSTNKTFVAFDEGLAEVSARLANTVESIRESVENLPKVIRQDLKTE